jgi:BlaI family transcriptional regulator, penicillinase repressor
MARPASQHPTDAELEILNILWRKGSGSLREMVERDRSGFPSRYTAAVREKATQTGMLRGLVQKVFEGSTRKMLVRAVEESGLSDEDLKELRRLIDGVRKQRRGNKR